MSAILDTSRKPWSFYHLASIITDDDLDLNNFDTYPPESQVRIIIALLALKKLQLTQFRSKYEELLKYCLGQINCEDDMMEDIEENQVSSDAIKKEEAYRHNEVAQGKESNTIHDSNTTSTTHTTDATHAANSINTADSTKIQDVKHSATSGMQDISTHSEKNESSSNDANIVKKEDIFSNIPDEMKTSSVDINMDVTDDDAMKGLEPEDIQTHQDKQLLQESNGESMSGDASRHTDSSSIKKENDNLVIQDESIPRKDAPQESWITVISQIILPYIHNHTLKSDITSEEAKYQVRIVLREIEKAFEDNVNLNLLPQRHEMYMSDLGGETPNLHCSFQGDNSLLQSASKYLDTILNPVQVRKPTALSERIQKVKPTNLLPQSRKGFTPGLGPSSSRTPQISTPVRTPQSQLPKKRTVMLLDNKPTKKTKLNNTPNRTQSISSPVGHGMKGPPGRTFGSTKSGQSKPSNISIPGSRNVSSPVPSGYSGTPIPGNSGYYSPNPAFMQNVQTPTTNGNGTQIFSQSSQPNGQSASESQTDNQNQE